DLRSDFVKWVVYLMLLANAGYFAVSYRETRNAPPPKPPVLSGADHVNRLLLLNEVDPEELRARAASFAPTPPTVSTDGPEAEPEISAAPAAACLSIGPLVDDSQIAAMRTWLLAMGGDPRLRVGERRELARYWVYFPPLPSREEAVARAQQMRAVGIDDLIVIPRGDMANAISLGVFSKRASLDRRLRELRAHGYEPSIVPRYRTQKASWFDVSFEPGEEVSEQMISQRFPGVELSEARCEPGKIAAEAADFYNAGSAPRRYYYSEDPGAGGVPTPDSP
ncbi:MAG: SPOR domain-containing protein, partial [Gammaproteobacteria bacterium]|nr:SPOR domain-containing protein [Gammaproteobacteria bacterium]